MIKPHGIEDFKFSFETAEAHQWYDPLKPYTKLEYEWVRALDLTGQVVVDAGCHHGNYAVVFKGCDWLVCIDVNAQFTDICRRNLELNGMRECSDVITAFMRKGHGVKQIDGTMADIYKMDIEGYEFELFPQELADNQQVHTWIVEIHPNHGSPDTLAQMFSAAGYDLLKVCRETMTIRPYVIGEEWPTHATLIARRE